MEDPADLVAPLVALVLGSAEHEALHGHKKVW